MAQESLRLRQRGYIPKLHALSEGLVAPFDFIIGQGLDAVDAEVVHVVKEAMRAPMMMACLRRLSSMANPLTT